MSTPLKPISPNWSRFGWQVEGEYQPPGSPERPRATVRAFTQRKTPLRAWIHCWMGLGSWILAFMVFHGPLAWFALVFGLFHLVRGGWLLAVYGDPNAGAG